MRPPRFSCATNGLLCLSVMCTLKKPVAFSERSSLRPSDSAVEGPPPPAPAPPVLCYCERPAALLDGRWVCAQLVEGDFCILGREDE